MLNCIILSLKLICCELISALLVCVMNTLIAHNISKKSLVSSPTIIKISKIINHFVYLSTSTEKEILHIMYKYRNN